MIGSSVPVSAPGDNTGATSQPGEPAGNIFPSVWFRWTAPNSEAVRVLACGAQPAKQIAVFIGTDLQHLGSPAMVTGAPFGGCASTFHAVAGSDYWIKVGGATGPFTLTIRPWDPPQNDDLNSAQVIGPGLPLSVSGTTVDASVDVPGGAYAPNVWYDWTSPITGLVEFDICASTEPPDGSNVLIYTGDDLFGLTRVGGSSICAFTFPAVAGQNYKITFQTDSEGPFTLSMDLADPPPNDDFADREVLPSAIPISLERDNIDATEESADLTFPVDFSVWFEWTAPVDAEPTIDACDADFDAWVVVTQNIDNTVGGLGPITASGYCYATFDAEKGETYEFKIGSNPVVGTYGDGFFTLSLDGPTFPDPPPQPPVVTPAASAQPFKSKKCKKHHRGHKKCPKRH